MSRGDRDVCPEQYGLGSRVCLWRLVRNILSHMPLRDRTLAATALCSIYVQINQEAGMIQLQAVYDTILPRW